MCPRPIRNSAQPIPRKEVDRRERSRGPFCENLIKSFHSIACFRVGLPSHRPCTNLRPCCANLRTFASSVLKRVGYGGADDEGACLGKGKPRRGTSSGKLGDLHRACDIKKPVTVYFVCAFTGPKIPRHASSPSKLTTFPRFREVLVRC